MTVSRTLEKSITFEQKRHLEKSLGALSELLDKEENRDVDTVTEFLEAVRFMNEHGGMKYKGVQLQKWLNEKDNR